MKVLQTNIPEVYIVEPQVFGDDRGFFLETWNLEKYRENGIEHSFVQDNMSYSRRGGLRGLHFQRPGTQGKLVSVIEGEVFDVAVDIRVESPTFGQWIGVTLDGKTKKQLYVPEGFAHGFVVLSEAALFCYKCTAPYRPQFEHTILWNDKDLAIEWPIENPSLSQKDIAGSSMQELYTKGMLPTYRSMS